MEENTSRAFENRHIDVPVWCALTDSDLVYCITAVWHKHLE